MKKYYVASKVKHAPMWKDFRAEGVSIIATWIDEAGQGETEDLGELAERCLSEIAEADGLILYAEPGEILKGALIEVGAALALGKQVVFVGDSKSVNVSRVFSSHSLWSEATSLGEAFKQVTEIQPKLPNRECTLQH